MTVPAFLLASQNTSHVRNGKPVIITFDPKQTMGRAMIVSYPTSG